MNEFLNYMLFGWYPYVALTVLIVGSILRFDRAQYSWRSQSSQFLRRKQISGAPICSTWASSCCSGGISLGC